MPYLQRQIIISANRITILKLNLQLKHQRFYKYRISKVPHHQVDSQLPKLGSQRSVCKEAIQ